MRLKDVDNDLVKVMGRVEHGEVITLKGRVLDRNDTPQAGLRVEIWQCDLNGLYLRTRTPMHTIPGYPPDQPENARDRMFRRLSDQECEQVTMVFEDGRDGAESTVNIIV